MPLPYASTYSLFHSVGVNTHLNYGDTNYGNFPLVRAQLASLGVKHIRDGLHCWPNADALQDLYSKFSTLAKDGIRFSFVVDPSENLGPITSSLMNAYWNLAAMAVDYYEGPNELDIRAGLGAPWPQVTRDFQQSVWNAVKGMAYGTFVPVVAPSLAFASNAPQLGDLTMWCDLGNLHAYPGGNPPTAAIPAQIAQIAPVSGNKQIIVTETGYTVLATDPQRVSELAQAKYMLRILLLYFQNGISRSYIYELLDEPNGFGLVRVDGTVRPAFTAVKNLLSIIGKVPTLLRSLTYTLSGPPVSQLLLQENDFSWILCLWQEVPSYNLVSHQDITNQVIPVTVTAPNGMRIEVYEPLLQPEPMNIVGNSASIAVPDHPVLLRITQ